MGRREEPVDPSLGPVQSFAYELRKLRADAGSPSYRQLAVRANYSASALSTAARGTVLPSWPVVLAFVRACGADEQTWRARWQEAADAVAGGPAEEPSTSDSSDVPHTSDGPPAPPVPAPLWSRWRPLLALVTVATVLVSSALVAWQLLRTTQTPTTRARQTALVPPAAPGRDCAPDGIVAPTASGPASPGPAQIRMDFEPGTPPWGPYWHNENVHERLVGDHPYHGANALEVRVGPGFAAVGTVHVDDLAPGSTITLHVWYGGQGEGRLCPFVQGHDYLIRWVPVAPLTLDARVPPGWRTYTWQMPDVPIQGVGIQLDDTGVTDLVLDLDAVSW